MRSDVVAPAVVIPDDTESDTNTITHNWLLYNHYDMVTLNALTRCYKRRRAPEMRQGMIWSLSQHHSCKCCARLARNPSTAVRCTATRTWWGGWSIAVWQLSWYWPVEREWSWPLEYPIQPTASQKQHCHKPSSTAAFPKLRLCQEPSLEGKKNKY